MRRSLRRASVPACSAPELMAQAGTLVLWLNYCAKAGTGLGRALRRLAGSRRIDPLVVLGLGNRVRRGAGRRIVHGSDLVLLRIKGNIAELGVLLDQLDHLPF